MLIYGDFNQQQTFHDKNNEGISMGCNGINEDNDGNGLIIEAWDYSYPMAVYILL